MIQMMNYLTGAITGELWTGHLAGVMTLGLLIAMLARVYRTFGSNDFEQLRRQGLVPRRLNKPRTTRAVGDVGPMEQVYRERDFPGPEDT